MQPLTIPPIAGLSLYADFVDAETAHALITFIDGQIWMTGLKRRVQHYGYVYDYRARSIDPSMYLGGLPARFAALGERLLAAGIFDRLPDQCIVNEYLPGQGIANHTDCEPCFGDVIASLSLGSGCMMRFTPVGAGEVAEVYLPPNSLLVMTGAARYDWQHGIAPRKSDVVAGQKIGRGRRLSLTLRTVIV